GYLDDVTRLFSSHVVGGGPTVINAVDPDVLRRECVAAGFDVEQVGWFGAEQVEQRALGAPAPNMELVGAIATKPAPQTVTSSDGVPIRYRVRGDADTAVVFVHGLGCDGSFWDAQRDRFADRHTVVTLDLAGHGASGGRRSEWTVENFAGDVSAVLSAAVPSVRSAVLVGHSLGGPVALAAAERTDVPVAGVVGVDTLQNLALRPVSDERIERYADSFASLPVRAAEMLLDPGRTDLVERVDAARNRVGAEVIGAAFRNLLRYQQRLPERFPVPLVLVNSSDWMPTDTDAAAARDVRVETLRGVGHFPMLEAPELLNAVLTRQVDRLLRE
ncbi:MAG: alpha/beta fold hydrolase, partial [Phycicoccus sp.]